jgi:nucleoside-triphosphatase
MPNNVFITGPPRIGKTTIIKHLIKDLKPLIMRGFFKECIIDNQICKGYRILTLDFREQVLAHIHFEGPDRIGEYGINIEGFENFVLPELEVIEDVELFIIDEISNMECLSKKFCIRVLQILESDIPLIASLSLSDIPEILDIKNRNDISILNVTYKNRNALWKKILLEI